jgi:hypothetical protein
LKQGCNSLWHITTQAQVAVHIYGKQVAHLAPRCWHRASQVVALHGPGAKVTVKGMNATPSRRACDRGRSNQEASAISSCSAAYCQHRGCDSSIAWQARVQPAMHRPALAAHKTCNEVRLDHSVGSDPCNELSVAVMARRLAKPAAHSGGSMP